VSIRGSRGLPGVPSPLDTLSYSGKKIWGLPPTLESPRSGKVGSVVAVNGVLYALGGFWTPDNSPDPVQASGRGPPKQHCLVGGFREILANGLLVAFPRAIQGNGHHPPGDRPIRACG
jgi:hypothetical protein